MRLSNNALSKNGLELIAPDEEFNSIANWNKYFLSNYGRLVHENCKGAYKIVNPSITKGGYLTYTLCKKARTYKGKKVRDENGKTKNQKKCKTAHQLVAMLYVRNPYPEEYTIEDLHVHHKDNNRQNNYYKNLMWLCKGKNGRKDHDFIHSIKKIAIYNEKTTQYHSYKDIDLLLKRLKISVLELIDNLKFNDVCFKSQDGKWDTYNVNGYFVGVQYYKNAKKNK